MNKTSNESTNRLSFLDNLRSLVVVLVLIFHAGASYSSAVDFWPYQDANTSRIIDIFMLLGDMFMMALLFFVAGYFALPSIKKKGCKNFVIAKLKTLGLPWIVITTGVLPVLDYIHFSARNSQSPNFGQYWLSSMAKIIEFHVGWLNMDSYMPMPEHFYQRYVWFLSLLILFFIIFALLYALNKKTKIVSLSKSTAFKTNLIPFLIGGLLTILPFAIVKLFVYQNILASGWFSLGNILQFQLGKIFIYAIYFYIGVYAYSMKWFRDGKTIGKCWAWGAACITLFGINMLVFKMLNETVTSTIFKLIHVVVYPLWILSFLGLLLAFAFGHWNKSTTLNRGVAKHSYNMYLIHYVFPMLLPLLLSGIDIPALTKFGIVATATVLLSYLTSCYILSKYPKQTVIGITVFSVILVAVT